MKILFSLLVLLSSWSAYANNIIVNGTRFVYPEYASEITVQMTNTGSSPSLAQVWLDEGDADALPETITTPFVISPPIVRVDADNGQSIRIKKITSEVIPVTDRESLWWLNILDVPSVDKTKIVDNAAILNLVIRSRFKFFWRPEGLGDREGAEQKLKLQLNHNDITLINPTPFFLTVSDVRTLSGTSLLAEGLMIDPKSRKEVLIKHNVKEGESLLVQAVNDYGGVVETKVVANK
ncbi:molecular chaperone [Buttiauxella sp. WJP83]|uniref:fimbrial biogenesis chaperone n=1 Tax=Buttiauxella sp. WJP83 TaxID=2986951 RepID=UPI0022DCF0B0|nr:molecular chaperone [Buttiauxella sp. WJP83]WBM68860.1 molecular chaperone [Buttiauxella sp. WJP83]